MTILAVSVGQNALIEVKASRAQNFTNQRVRRGSEVDEAEREWNRNKFEVRGRLEHVFAVVERLWGFGKVRCRAPARNASRSFGAPGLANIDLAHHRSAWKRPKRAHRAPAKSEKQTKTSSPA